MREINECIVGDIFYDTLKKREFTITEIDPTAIRFDNGGWLSYADFPVPKGRYKCIKEFSPKFNVGDIVEDGSQKRGFVVQTGSKVSVQWMGNNYIVYGYPEHLLNLFAEGRYGT